MSVCRKDESCRGSNSAEGRTATVGETSVVAVEDFQRVTTLVCISLKGGGHCKELQIFQRVNACEGSGKAVVDTEGQVNAEAPDIRDIGLVWEGGQTLELCVFK